MFKGCFRGKASEPQRLSKNTEKKAVPEPDEEEKKVDTTTTQNTNTNTNTNKEEKKEESKTESQSQKNNKNDANNGGMPIVQSKHSLVYKYLTPEIYNKYKDHRTKTSNCSLDQCISCAVSFDDQHCGIYAADIDCYTDFKDLFDPIIKDYHNFDGQHKSDLDITKLKENEKFNNILKTDKDSIQIKSTRIRVGRNVNGFGLSPGITTKQRTDFENLMKQIFNTFEGEFKGNYYPLQGMDEATRLKLVEDHFLFISGDRNLICAGMERDWPSGRGIFHNKEKNFLVWVNEEDQLRIISMQKGGQVKQVFNRLIKGINLIEQQLKLKGFSFAFDEKLGYIHSCPTNLGTGMRASVHIELPYLKKKLGGSDELKKYCKEKLKLQARGTRGESSGDTGHVYDISNRHRLGYTEIELVQTMIDGVQILYSLNEDAKNEFEFEHEKNENKNKNENENKE